jgi:membrane-associated phospholipid phosphatase
MFLIEWMQSFATPWLTLFFEAVTFLGDEPFYIVVLPMAYWLWNREKATALIYILLPSLLINAVLKELIQAPRPVGMALIEQGGWSFPSGHAQGAMTLWLSIALLADRRWLSWFSGTLIFLIGLSRIYLGVHFPVDVAGGWFIGFLLVWLYFSFIRPFMVDWLGRFGDKYRIVFASTLILLLMLIFPHKDAVTILAILWGVTLGIVWYPSRSPVMDWRQFLIIAFGVVGIIVIWIGLKKALPPELIYRFIRYALIGVWISLAIPWLQRRLA